MDFAVPADHRMKSKESEKNYGYLDLGNGMKNLWNMEMNLIQIVSSAIGTVIKGLVQRLEDLEIRQVETIQTTALLRSDRILRRVLET